jgi:hypothetical protein
MRSGLAPTSPLGNTWDLGRHCIRRSAGGAGSRSILDLVLSQGSLPNGPKLVGSVLGARAAIAAAFSARTSARVFCSKTSRLIFSIVSQAR